MKIAIVASSTPARGNHPIVVQGPAFFQDARGELFMKFVNTGLLGRSQTLSFSSQVLAVSPVPEEIIKPYGVEAAKLLALGSVEANIFRMIPHLGEMVAASMGNSAAAHAQRSGLAGCALVYQNAKDALVAILLCGVVQDVVTLIQAVPEARRSEQLPPPFSIEALAKISESHARGEIYDY
jgi:hypothetical protein